MHLFISFLFLSISGLATTTTPDINQYSGSSFNEVWSVITGADKFKPKDSESLAEYSAYQAGQLPKYPVTNTSLFSKDKNALAKDSVRTINERFDYYDRITKKIHPNGVCVAGEWTIYAPTPYSGYLATGSKGLFIGRISTAMGETEAGKNRGFGIAGKVFPTLNRDEIVKTGNFFTVDVLLGTKIQHALEAKTTNQPEVGFDLSLIGLMIKVSSALSKGDKDPSFRPLTDIANLKHDDSISKQPKWMRLGVSSQLKMNNERDFRNEVLKAMEENSEIKYSIEISDTTHDRKTTSGWIKIGEINLNQAVASYGCDRRLHFAHPKLK